MATRMDTELMRPDERRGSMDCDVRLATVNRVARLVVGDETGLARLHRISNGGVELSSIMDLHVGQMVCLDLSETVSARVAVIAKNGKRYALAFQQEINCAALLRQLVAEARSNRARPLRLTTPPLRAEGRSLKGDLQLELEDISQHGMKVRHDGSFHEGLRVCVQLPNGRECRGIVRWTKGRMAGLQLLDVLSADDLGAVSRLQSSATSSSSGSSPGR